MKKILLLLLTLVSLTTYAQQKVQKKLSATELKLNGLVCDCLTKIDISKLKNSEEAGKAFEDCVTAHAELIVDIAQERKIDVSDEKAMSALGVEIGKNLLSQNCSAALKLGMKMNDDKAGDEAEVFEGAFKRIEEKGFNYLVLTDNAGSEKSFLWLRQFPGSEQLAAPAAQLTGKKIKITSTEIEVYLPQAKGYYKVKEITAIEFL